MTRPFPAGHNTFVGWGLKVNRPKAERNHPGGVPLPPNWDDIRRGDPRGRTQPSPGADSPCQVEMAEGQRE